MRLIASEAALDMLVALDQADEPRLSALARACGVGVSTAQKALQVLVDDGLAARSGERTYQPCATPAARALLELAIQTRAIEEVARIVGRANPGVELIGRAHDQLVIVAARHADAAQRLRARRILGAVAEREGLQLVERQHDDLRTYRADFAHERDELAQGRLFYGDLDLSYPPVQSHVRAPRRLGRLNPALTPPSARRLRTLYRRHGVRRLRVFGSAVRDDFRPDSDVDIAVELKPGTPHRTLAHLEEDLERLLDRDVDVVLLEALRSPVRAEVEQHGVPLVG